MNTKHGIHGPNCPLNKMSIVPNGPPNPRSVGYRFGAGNFKWAKLLQSDHTPDDAIWLQGRGIRVIVRAKGEAIVYNQDVMNLIVQYRRSIVAIEVGNEPPPDYKNSEALDTLFRHAWYLENVWQSCSKVAHDIGISLITGGWQALSLLPPADTGIGQRLREVYSLYDGTGVHCYDPFDLNARPVQEHLQAWHNEFPDKPVYITEAGIASKMIGDAEKARRYASFVRDLPDYVSANFFFIMGGTPEWYSFNSDGQYDPNGENSYVLSDQGWALLGDLLSQ